MVEIRRKEYRIKELIDGSIEVIISNGLVEETLVLEKTENESTNSCLICPYSYQLGSSSTCIACSDALRVLLDNKIISATEIICKSYKITEVDFPDQEIKKFSLKDLRESICEKICDSETGMCKECLREDNFCYIRDLLRREIKREDI